jgi:hypothetical protein
MNKIKLTETELAEIKRIAAEYQIEALPFVQTKAGGVYCFQHPKQKGTKGAWVFAIDWKWHQCQVRFHRRFIPCLEQANLVEDIEAGAGRNCSVMYSDFRRALQVCLSEISTEPES